MGADRRSPHGLHVVRELDELYCRKCRKRWGVGEEMPECDDRRQGATDRREPDAPAFCMPAPEALDWEVLNGAARVYVQSLNSDGRSSEAMRAVYRFFLDSLGG